ncbi:MAG: TerB N-terminal domain-containing protein [Oscillospiraceae bacterium]
MEKVNVVFDTIEAGKTLCQDLSIDEVYQVIKEKPKRSIDLSQMKNRVLKELCNLSKKNGLDFELPELCEKDPSKKHYSIRKVHEKALLNYAELVFPLKLFEDISATEVVDYVSGYYDLSYDEFRSYISWRTQAREGTILPCSNGFLFLHLMELCNFIECDDVESTLSRIRELSRAFENDKTKTNMIEGALFEFTALYCSEVELNSYENWSFQKLKNSIQLISGDYSDAFDFLTSYYTYKGMYKGIPNPFTNEEDEPLLRKLFPTVLKEINLYFKSNGIDIFRLWCGKLMYRNPHLKYVLEFVNDAIVTKNAFYLGNIESEYYICVDSNCKEPIKVLCQFQQDEDYDGTLFFDHSILLYLLNSFLNEYLRFAGKSQVDDIRSDLVNRPYRNELREIVVKAFISDSYQNTISKAILNAGVEAPERSSRVYIYCTVKFEGVRRTYSYLTDDERTQVGDFVLAPLGAENCVTVGQIVEVIRCSAGNAPYPPSKTKHILSKTKKPDGWDR